MKQAIIIELKKLMKSRVGIITSVLLGGGIGAISTLLLLGLKEGNPDIIAQLGPGATFSWQTLLKTATQVAATAGLLGFGVVIAWHFAREFSDKTIYGMFSLPVSHGKIAVAKITAFLLWCIAVSLVLPLVIVLVGLLIGLGSSIPQTTIEALIRLHLLLLMTSVITLPVGIVATKSRSLLGGVGAAICLVVLASVIALTSIAGWFTPAAPALWAIQYTELVSTMQLLLIIPYGVASVGLLVTLWSHMELD